MADTYRDLMVWHRAMQLGIALYRLTALFPSEELLGITSQLRKAGVAVATHIADGWGRQSSAEYRQYIGMARSANLEVQTLLTLCSELHFGEPEALRGADALSQEISKLLSKLLTNPPPGR
jgi:four helix bundle protein